MDFTKLRMRERLNYPTNVKAGRVKLGDLRTRKYSDNSIAAEVVVDTAINLSPISIERTWDQINPGPPYRAGGQFCSIKADLPSSELKGQGVYRRRNGISPTYYTEYTGGFGFPQFTNDPVLDSAYMRVGWDSPVNPILIPHVSSDCSQVFKRMRPKFDRAGMGVFLAEARDLPRMLQTSSRALHEAWRSMGGNATSTLMQPKKLADNFINHQFGWVPFLHDLGQFYDVSQNAGKYIELIEKNNGTYRRRKKTMRSNSFSKTLYKGYHAGVLPWGQSYEQMCFQKNVDGNTCYANYTVTEEIEDLEWAVGSFTFYHPSFDRLNPSYASIWHELNRQRLLYGARLNPSVIYKATPWSWLIDWFSNVGDIIDNANAIGLDKVVAKYLYLMNRRVRKVTFTTNINFWTGPIQLSWSRYVDTKQREDANNPYDFCLGRESLTARQVAILGALGISRYF